MLKSPVRRLANRAVAFGCVSLLMAAAAAPSAPAQIQTTVVDDAKGAAFDEDGDMSSAVLMPAQMLPAMKLAPAPGVRAPILSYPDGTPGGPLDPASLLASSSVTASADPVVQPVNTGGCDLIDPDVVAFYDYDIKRYAYWGPTGGDCPKSTNVTIYCYSELWRVRDNQVVGQKSDAGNENQGCYAGAETGFWYHDRAKHYVKAVVQFQIEDRSYWGYGKGPRGWDCTGQGSRRLVCQEQSKSES